MKSRSHRLRWVKPLLVTFCVLLATAWTRPATAQPITAAPPPRETEDGIIFNERLEVAQLINFVAERLNISFVWDDQTEKLLTGPQAPRIVLRQQRPLKEAELLPFLEAVLQTLSGPNALIVSETAKPGLHRLTAQTRTAGMAAEQVYVLDEHLRLPPTDATVISVVVTLKDTTQQAAVSAFATLLGGPQAGGSATPIGQTGLVLLTGSRARIQTALDLIKRLPEDLTELVFEVIELVNLDPQTAVAPIQSIIGVLAAQAAQEGTTQPRQPQRLSMGSATAVPGTRKIVVVAPRSIMTMIHEVIAQLDSGEPMTTRVYIPKALAARDFANLAQQVLVGGVRVRTPGMQATVEHLGSVVIVHASAADHRKVAELLQTFEDLPAHQRQVVRYFQVKHRPAEEIMTVLEGLFAKGTIEGEIDRRSAPGRERATDPAAMRRQELAEAQGVTDLPQPGVSLSGDQDVLLDLTLDEPTNTIIARGETVLVDQVKQIISDLDVRQAQVRIEVFLVSLSETQALNLGVELEGEFSAGTTSFNLASLFGLGLRPGQTTQPTNVAASGFTGLAVSPGDFSAVIRALETIGASEAVSKPTLLVNNNAEATLYGVFSEPFATITQGQATTEQTYGGDKQAGTILSITPQIAEGSHLILRYEVELSSFTGEATSVLPPPSREDRVASTVTIPDGYTVIVGGLEDRSRTQTINQVPLLGSLPIIGEAFKSRAQSSSRNRLYVFVRASIERSTSFEKLKYWSDSALDETYLESDLPMLRPVWIDSR